MRCEETKMFYLSISKILPAHWSGEKRMNINQEIASIFYEMADLLDILGVEWKPIAFRKAARTIETYSKPIEELVKKKGIKGVMELPGIGEGIGKKIIEYVETGKIKEYGELKKKIPHGVEEMLNVPGLGPKKAAQLYKKLKIDSIEKLEKAVKGEKIRTLSGFGEKSEGDILTGLAIVKKGMERKPIGMILPYARSIVDEIKKIQGVTDAELAGSLRRRKETVKDMDIVVFTQNPEKVSKQLTKLREAKTVIRIGEKMTSVRFNNGLQSDMRMLSPELYGSGMVHFTGSKEHGIALRERAIKMGMKFSEYGLMKGKKIIASKKEEDVYKGIKLPFIPPELRENDGEIEAGEKGELPSLVEYNEIKGDVHVHTNWDDGRNTTEEMVKKAISLGYEYVALTDHSPSDIIANGLSEKRIMKHWKEIEQLQKKYPKINILKGSEVAILKSGKLDFPDRILKELDIVIASIHSGFKNDTQTMTKRITNALENEYVHFMGHPTGRLINKRNAYAFELEKVLTTAEKNRKGMEINAQPYRMDLNAQHVKECIRRKIPLFINTDSHSAEEMDYMTLGIGQARRGWAEKKDIVNSLLWKSFQKKIKR
ncbi:MAG: DNA polymerase/3'-5' exonuclease PolX [Candidatus Diapherotrites archaeon]